MSPMMANLSRSSQSESADTYRTSISPTRSRYTSPSHKKSPIRNETISNHNVNPMIRPPLSEIARAADIWVKEWAHWKHYHGILTYNMDSTGVLQLYRHELDPDPHRFIQMSEFVKVYPSRDCGNRFEFTIEERSGVDIVMASDTTGDRSAWMTSLGIFMKMEEPKLVIRDLALIDQDTSKQKSADLILSDRMDALEATLQSQTKMIEQQAEIIQGMHQIQTQLAGLTSCASIQGHDSLVTVVSAQMQDQQRILAEIMTRLDANIHSKSSISSHTSEKPTQFMLAAMNEKLVKLITSVDYISSRLTQTLKRDQDVLRNQEALSRNIEKQSDELRYFKKFTESEHESVSLKLDKLIASLHTVERRSGSDFKTHQLLLDQQYAVQINPLIQQLTRQQHQFTRFVSRLELGQRKGLIETNASMDTLIGSD